MVVAAVLLGLAPSTPAKRTLTFEERVEAQIAIARVYHRHRIGERRDFEDATPRHAIEARVSRYLRQSRALARYWDRPVTAAMLRAELERIARRTRFPDRLTEIYDALGNDPIVIQECFARPVLVDRLSRGLFATDRRLHEAAREEAEQIYRDLLDGRLNPSLPHPRRRVESPGDGTGIGLREEADGFVVRTGVEGPAGRRESVSYVVPKRTWDDWWGEISPGLDPYAEPTVALPLDALPLPEDRPEGVCSPGGTWDATDLIADDPPLGRSGYSMVAAGAEVLIWGGASENQEALQSGLRFHLATDTWEPMSIQGAPTERSKHAAVWTGNRLIVWGGEAGDFYTVLDTGGRYDPVTDSWTPTSMTGAPAARSGSTTVWTGEEMILWGGSPSGAHALPLGDGARYNPDTDTWASMSLAGAPTPRLRATAVWTGQEMIVWGGAVAPEGGSTVLNDGARYSPATDSWTPVPDTGAPDPRQYHAAVWTGQEMIVWGGRDGSYGVTHLNTGGRYDPDSETWLPTSMVGVPTERESPSLVWTGTEAIVWGGWSFQNGQWVHNPGAKYNPSDDTWSPISESGAPDGGTAVWTGDRMFVWGGGESSAPREAGLYDPVSDTWTALAANPAPVRRDRHTAVWTGDLMIVWGGYNGEFLNSGGRYDPLTDSWTPMADPDPEPVARWGHTAVWTGELMIVWGASSFSGGRYDPVLDEWRTKVSTAPIDQSRRDFTTVWTGAQMIVWGGASCCQDFNDGAAWDAQTNTWSTLSLVGAPSARNQHAAVWTGSEMIVWGGVTAGARTDTGGKYDPLTGIWTPTSTAGAPAPRSLPTAIWTGDRMILWGGDGSGVGSSGGQYDPLTDTWLPISEIGAPEPRVNHTAIWTGGSMVIWGGEVPGLFSGHVDLGSGGQYSPLLDTWTATPTVGAPLGRYWHTAIWSGTSMLVYGGRHSNGDVLVDGGRFIPESDGDGDGFGCSGDCLDTDPSVFPGAPQVCDGENNDCSDPVWPSLDGTNEADADSDGFSECDGDCNLLDAGTYPGAPEINDGADNQCPGDLGFGAVDETSGDSGFHDLGDLTTYSWTAQAEAQKYETARSTQPDFSVACDGTATNGTSWSDPALPPLGAVLYYLTRPLTPNAGSWGLRSSGVERSGLCLS